MGDTLIVEGQRVLATQTTKVKGTKRIADIPLGYEVKASGQPNASGVLIAQQIEALATDREDSQPPATDSVELQRQVDEQTQQWFRVARD